MANFSIKSLAFIFYFKLKLKAHLKKMSLDLNLMLYMIDKILFDYEALKVFPK